MPSLIETCRADFHRYDRSLGSRALQASEYLKGPIGMIAHAFIVGVLMNSNRPWLYTSLYIGGTALFDSTRPTNVDGTVREPSIAHPIAARTLSVLDVIAFSAAVNALYAMTGSKVPNPLYTLGKLGLAIGYIAVRSWDVIKHKGDVIPQFVTGHMDMVNAHLGRAPNQGGGHVLGSGAASTENTPPTTTGPGHRLGNAADNPGVESQSPLNPVATLNPTPSAPPMTPEHGSQETTTPSTPAENQQQAQQS